MATRSFIADDKTAAGAGPDRVRTSAAGILRYQLNVIGATTQDVVQSAGGWLYDRARAGLTRTWQSTELFDDLSVFENLTVAARESGVTEDDAKRTLAVVGMDWAAEAEPSALSSGQRKLVGVARALVARPRLLCLDEPAAGLDTGESEELGVTLRRLADQGQSMLLIEHDMGLVLGICDRVVVLEFGKVIAEGTPEAVRKDPRVIAAYLGEDLAEPAEAAAAETAEKA